MINREFFYSNFPNKNEVFKNTTSIIFDIFEKDEKFIYMNELAYILATIKHETADTFNPSIREIGKGRGRKYGVVDSNGQIYYGRGLCQLTWNYNYEKFSKILGIDLINNPDLALEPQHSVSIIMIGMRDGIFTGKKLSDYFKETSYDYYKARKIINGLDKAELIKSYAEDFANKLQKK